MELNHGTKLNGIKSGYGLKITVLFHFHDKNCILCGQEIVYE